MTPKDKAYQIWESMWIVEKSIDRESARRCALVCVHEICEAINWHEFEFPNEQWEYWNKVKQEIENL